MPCSSASIVYSNSFLSQTSNLSSTTLITSSGGGLYRVSVGGDASSGVVNVDVTLANGATYDAQSVIDGTGTVYVSGTCETFFVPSGGSINISATIKGGTPTYNVYVVVEQLQ